MESPSNYKNIIASGQKCKHVTKNNVVRGLEYRIIHDEKATGSLLKEWFIIDFHIS